MHRKATGAIWHRHGNGIGADHLLIATRRGHNRAGVGKANRHQIFASQLRGEIPQRGACMRMSHRERSRAILARCSHSHG